MPTVTTAGRLTSSELPLVLLAVVGYPERSFRKELLCRLDAAIDAMALESPAPAHSQEELRVFFRGLGRGCCSGVKLPHDLRELAVRLALLAFTKPADDRQRRLFIGEGGPSASSRGVLVSPDLSVFDRRSAWLQRQRNGQRASVFVANSFMRRLQEIRTGLPPVKAVCRVASQIVLEFRGAIPWSLSVPVRGNLPVRDRTLYPGWEYEQHEHFLRLWPDSPEGVLRLTAGMAAGKTLSLCPRNGQRSGVIVVRLRDFDGESAELPVKVCPSQGEPWLSRLPAPPLGLTLDDRVKIARWAYPLREWLTPELLERLS